jgi:hypothetical protein
VKNKKVHLIGMYKFAKTKFEYQGKSLTHAQINNILGKPRRCRSLGYQYKQAKVMYQGVEICLFFSRRGKHDNWKVLLTTDTKLTFKSRSHDHGIVLFGDGQGRLKKVQSIKHCQTEI